MTIKDMNPEDVEAVIRAAHEMRAAMLRGWLMRLFRRRGPSAMPLPQRG